MSKRQARYRIFDHAFELLGNDRETSDRIVAHVVDKLYDQNMILGDTGLFINRFVRVRGETVHYIYVICAEDKGQDCVVILTRKDAKDQNLEVLGQIEKFDKDHPPLEESA